jgi:DNA-binding NtrC family response regulator
MLGISRATLYRKLKRYNIPGSGSDSSSHTLQ